MSLVTVFRVEDNTQAGPYRVQARHSERQQDAAMDLANRHTEWILWRTVGPTLDTHPHIHPGPSEDPGMMQRWFDMESTKQYRFGFPSARRLGEWFFGERDTLELLRMHVAEYVVPHQAVMRGEWQLAFRHPSATLVGMYPLEGMVE